MSAEALRHVWLFSEMSDEQLESISSFTFEKSFDPGEIIVEDVAAVDTSFPGFTDCMAAVGADISQDEGVQA